jgi:hypothetical protein
MDRLRIRWRFVSGVEQKKFLLTSSPFDRYFTTLEIFYVFYYNFKRIRDAREIFIRIEIIL